MKIISHTQPPAATHAGDSTAPTASPSLSGASLRLSNAVRSARQFVQHLPASLQTAVNHIRTEAKAAFASLSKPPKTDEQKLTRLLRNEKVQSAIEQLANTGIQNLNTGQAMEAFRQLTDPGQGRSSDQRVNDFVDAFNQKLSPLLGSDSKPSLARSITAGQVIAGCVAKLDPGSAGAQDCSNALNSYLANTRPGMQQHEAFVDLLKEILTPPD